MNIHSLGCADAHARALPRARSALALLLLFAPAVVYALPYAILEIKLRIRPLSETAKREGKHKSRQFCAVRKQMCHHHRVKRRRWLRIAGMLLRLCLVRTPFLVSFLSHCPALFCFLKAPKARSSFDLGGACYPTICLLVGLQQHYQHQTARPFGALDSYFSPVSLPISRTYIHKTLCTPLGGRDK